ncbi:MAG: ral secretion pathway protein GspG [Betaproteobacteria bacterium]|nr:ral secretion pathway protein GspG [Betaproteobacteria bacterium]
MNAYRQRGFTLIEVLITLTILGILASALMPLMELDARRGREEELRHALREIRGAIDAYKHAADTGQIAKAADASGYPPSLEVLVEGVPALNSPTSARVYFLRRLPRDPLAPNTLAPAATWGKRSYASPPEPPAAGDDVFDVYSLAEGDGINGIAYRRW